MGAEGSRPTEVDPEEMAEKQREILRMDQIVRNKVRSGVQYNMKVILRGERGSGKTALWKRFQGLTFEDKYQPTAEIQSATINWSFKNNEDHVKVEVWDVVDKAIKNKTLTKVDGSGTASFGKNKIEYLDASAVDVFKDTHAVIFLINPLAAQSLAYVKEKLKEVPMNVSILLVLNFKDLVAEKDFKLNMNRRSKEDRVVFDEVLELCETLRTQRRRHCLENRLEHEYASLHCDVYAFEASLLNCYGLQQLHRLKTKALREQLRLSVADLHEADTFLQDNIHRSNYSDFEQKYESRKQKAIDTDFAVLESVGVQGNVERSLDSSSEEYSQGKHSKRSKKKDKLKAVEKDELAMSLNAEQERSGASGKQSADYNAGMLKLEHNDNKQKQKSKSTPKQVVDEDNRMKKSHFEVEVDTFRPHPQNAQESLEGFLEASDEEERRLYANKQKIKSYAKKSAKQDSSNDESDNDSKQGKLKESVRSASSAQQQPSKQSAASHSSDSEDDYNRQLTKSALSEKKIGAGKLVKRQKKKDEAFPTASLQSSSMEEARSIPNAIELTYDNTKNQATTSSHIGTIVTTRRKDQPAAATTRAVSSDDDVPAVMKYGSINAKDPDSDEDVGISKKNHILSKPSKMKKVGKPSIPKEIDL